MATNTIYDTDWDFLSLQILKNYVDNDVIGIMNVSTQLKIVYLLLLVSSIVVTVFRPKQQYQELTEEKNGHLTDRIGAKDQEVQEALALKAEFIRNVNHEYHAPMTGIMSMAESLQAAYDKISDVQRKNAIDVIVKSSHRLKTYDENIATLARLSKPQYELNKKEINFSQLIYERVQTCRKLYDDNKENREFVLDIVEDIKINADMGYMVQLLDNLIINSISYCKKGQIKVALSQNEENINFMIEDGGIGIPQHELSSIFEPFMVSSKTRTPAGGRGVGLAICKRILEVHSGTITAESNGEQGAIFRVVLPRLK